MNLLIKWMRRTCGSLRGDVTCLDGGWSVQRWYCQAATRLSCSVHRAGKLDPRSSWRARAAISGPDPAMVCSAMDDGGAEQRPATWNRPLLPALGRASLTCGTGTGVIPCRLKLDLAMRRNPPQAGVPAGAGPARAAGLHRGQETRRYTRCLVGVYIPMITGGLTPGLFRASSPCSYQPAARCDREFMKLHVIVPYLL